MHLLPGSCDPLASLVLIHFLGSLTSDLPTDDVLKKNNDSYLVLPWMFTCMVLICLASLQRLLPT